jgi:hypothetical protein
MNKRLFEVKDKNNLIATIDQVGPLFCWSVKSEFKHLTNGTTQDFNQSFRECVATLKSFSATKSFKDRRPVQFKDL